MQDLTVSTTKLSELLCSVEAQEPVASGKEQDTCCQQLPSVRGGLHQRHNQNAALKQSRDER